MASDEDRQSEAAIPLDVAAPRYLLVMTVTIVPAANAGVKRADPKLRLEDYKHALRTWLNYEHAAADRILLLENSGADLSQLRAIATGENPRRKPVEILSVPGNRIPEGTNYGYTEMQMLDVMVDCRKLGFPRRGFDAAVQLFACSHDFYDRVLRDAKKEMNSTDLRLLEHLIFRKVIPFKGQPGYYLRFPCNIEPVGYSGFKSRSYRSPKMALTHAIRAALRVIAPDYWF